MRTQLMISGALVTLLATATVASDRPVTKDKRVNLTAAVTAQGCSGGKMEFDTDDKHYEVDDAKCSDGRRYDLKFDTSFKLIEKELED
jgi:type 1 fimbria pilin